MQNSMSFLLDCNFCKKKKCKKIKLHLNNKYLKLINLFCGVCCTKLHDQCKIRVNVVHAIGKQQIFIVLIAVNLFEYILRLNEQTERLVDAAVNAKLKFFSQY